MSELDDIAGVFQSRLDHAAVAYLRGRGIDRDTALHFRLGLVDGELSPEWDTYRGRISIPYLNARGVQDLRFRSLSEGEGAKYLSRAGGSPLLFNSRVLAEDSGSDLLVLCEGEFDAMVVWQATRVPVVGVPGVSTWRSAKHWPRMVRTYPRVLMLADGDDAGRELGRAIAGDVEQVKVVPMPDDMDVSDFAARHGAEALRELISRSYSRTDGVT